MRGVLTAGIVLGLALSSFPTSVALADDTNKEVKESSDTSTNPLTGTVTRTRKFKKKRKHADGSTSQVETKEKRKVKTDGSVETSVDSQSSATPN